MAINPEISLGVRPPILQPLQIQDPLERYAKVQTLRQLMQQGQLRDLQTQQAQQELEQGRLAAEGEASFRKLYEDPTARPTESQVYGTLGPKGAAVIKTQRDIAKTQEERQENYMRILGQAALNSKTQQDRDFRINALAKGGVIPQEMAAQMLAQPFNLEETQAWGQMTMTAAEQLREKREADARAFAEKKQPYELRTAAAGATKAEQEATGTQPVKPAVPPALMPPDVEAQQTRLRMAGAPKLLTPAEEAQRIRVATAAADAQPATEAENRSLGFYDRSASADKTLEGVRDYISDKSTAGMWLTQTAPNSFLSKEEQSYMQGARQFINAYLRRDSGAAIQPSEWAEAYKTFLPYPGDKPDTLALKARERKVIIDGLKTSAARAYTRKYGEGGSTPPNAASKKVKVWNEQTGRFEEK